MKTARVIDTAVDDQRITEKEKDWTPRFGKETTEDPWFFRNWEHAPKRSYYHILGKLAYQAQAKMLPGENMALWGCVRYVPTRDGRVDIGWQLARWPGRGGCADESFVFTVRPHFDPPKKETKK